MGFALQYESLIELSFIMECEFDRSELECFDQPDALTLRYLGKNEHPVATAHTPDFLQISAGFIGYVECKPDETLSKLARERPGRWSRDSDGTWRSIPSEQAAARYGLAYRVRSSSSFCRVLLDNLAFLQDYRVPSCPSVGADVAQRIRDLVSRRLGLTLEELIHETGDPEAIYRLIALGALHVDLDRHFLSQPHLYRSSTMRSRRGSGTRHTRAKWAGVTRSILAPPLMSLRPAPCTVPVSRIARSRFCATRRFVR